MAYKKKSLIKREKNFPEMDGSKKKIEIHVRQCYSAFILDINEKKVVIEIVVNMC